MKIFGKKFSSSDLIDVSRWILLLLTGDVNQNRAHGTFCTSALQQEYRHLIFERDGDYLFPYLLMLCPNTGSGMLAEEVQSGHCHRPENLPYRQESGEII